MEPRHHRLFKVSWQCSLTQVESGGERWSFHSSLRGSVFLLHSGSSRRGIGLIPSMQTSAIGRHVQGDLRSTAMLTLLNTYSVLGFVLST